MRYDLYIVYYKSKLIDYYKSLDAYIYFISVCVQTIKHVTTNSVFIAKCEVRPSYRQSPCYMGCPFCNWECYCWTLYLYCWVRILIDYQIKFWKVKLRITSYCYIFFTM